MNCIHYSSSYSSFIIHIIIINIIHHHSFTLSLPFLCLLHLCTRPAGSRQVIVTVCLYWVLSSSRDTPKTSFTSSSADQVLPSNVYLSMIIIIIIIVNENVIITTRFDSFFADRLVDICTSNHFDGYLINIEIPAVPQNLLRLLSSFLNTLREGLHKQIPDSQLIWYDSIDSRGYLNYQNKLSRESMEWFRNVDGLFTNYWWKPEDLRMSKMMAKQR